MKKRLSRVLNFLALNLLFFALYLNFIHKDNNNQLPVSSSHAPSTSQRTVLVSNPEEYTNPQKAQQQDVQGSVKSAVN
jgi:hypothetical protein